MIFVDKTMYIELLEGAEQHFRYIFLRPRGFGKSAFLNMLCEYYDIHTADHFNDLFGPLYIGKNPTPSHNQYLVLKFDLSSISVSGSYIEMKESFNKVVNNDLESFIEKYSKELDYPTVNDVINTNDASISLCRVLVSYWLLVHCVNTCLIINMRFY